MEERKINWGEICPVCKARKVECIFCSEYQYQLKQKGGEKVQKTCVGKETVDKIYIDDQIGDNGIMGKQFINKDITNEKSKESTIGKTKAD